MTSPSNYLALTLTAVYLIDLVVDRLLIQRYYLLSAQQNAAAGRQRWNITSTWSYTLHLGACFIIHCKSQWMSRAHCRNLGQQVAFFTMTAASLFLNQRSCPWSDFQSSQDSWGIWCQTQFGLAEMTGCWKKGEDPSPGVWPGAVT